MKTSDQLNQVIDTTTAGGFSDPTSLQPLGLEQANQPSKIFNPTQSDIIDSAKAAFNTDTLSAIKNYIVNPQTAEDNFHPFQDADLKARGEQFSLNNADYFSDAPNKEVLDSRLSYLDQQRKDADIAQGNPVGNLVGGFGKGVVDPNYWIPFLGEAKAATVAARFFKGSALFATQTAASQAIQSTINPNITAEEAIKNVMIGGILGGVYHTVGGPIAKPSTFTNLSNQIIDKAGDETGAIDLRPSEEDFNGLKTLLTKGEPEAFTLPKDFQPIDELHSDTLEMDKSNNELFKAGNNGWRDFIAHPFSSTQLQLSRWNPIVSMHYSNDPYIRDMAQKLSPVNYVVKGNLENYARPDDIATTADAGILMARYKITTGLDQSYKMHVNEGGNLSQVDFERAVTQARLSRTADQSVPGLNNATKVLDDFYSGYAKKSLDNGIVKGLDRTPEGSKNYLPALPNHEAILNDYNGAEDAFTKEIYRSLKQGIEDNKQTELVGNAKVRNEKAERGEEEQTKANLSNTDVKQEANRIANDQLQTWLNSKGGGFNKLGTFDSRFMNERLHIDYANVSDYMEMSPRRQADIYSRSVEREIALKNVLGVDSPETLLGNIRKHFNDRIIEEGRKEEGGDPKVKTDLIKERDLRLSQVEGQMKSYLNQHESYLQANSMSSKAIKLAKEAVVFSKLGTVAITHLTNMLAPLHNLMVTSKGELLEKGFNGIKRIGLGPNDAKLLGIGMDHEMDNAAQVMYGNDDNPLYTNKFQQTIAKGDKLFLKSVGMDAMMTFTRKPQVEALGQQFVAMLGYLEKARLPAELQSKVDNEFSPELLRTSRIELNIMGIDKDLGKSILEETNKMFDKGDNEVDGVKLLNIADWGNQATAQRFLAILKRQTEATVPVPAYDSLPPILRTGVGKLVGFLKTWMFGAYLRSYIPNIQRIGGISSRHTMMGIWKMLSWTCMGSLIYVIKQLAQGTPPGQIDTRASRLAIEGFNRGGAFPLLDWGGQLLDAKGLGPQTLLEGGAPAKVKQDQSIVDLIGGPVAGITNDLYNAFGNIARGDGTARDAHNILRNAPLYSHPYVNFITHNLLTKGN